MKNIYRFIVFGFCFSCFLLMVVNAYSQPEPPALPVEHGLNGDQGSTGAPLLDSPGWLLILAGIYSASVLFKGRVKFLK